MTSHQPGCDVTRVGPGRTPMVHPLRRPLAAQPWHMGTTQRVHRTFVALRKKWDNRRGSREVFFFLKKYFFHHCACRRDLHVSAAFVSTPECTGQDPVSEANTVEDGCLLDCCAPMAHLQGPFRFYWHHFANTCNFRKILCDVAWRSLSRAMRHEKSCVTVNTS